MSKNRQSRTNMLTRKVLQEIITQRNHPPVSTVNVQSITNKQDLKYLQSKLNKYQIQINILSQQLSKEINLKEHVAYLYNKQKQKTAQLQQIIQNKRDKSNTKIDLKKSWQMTLRQRRASQQYFGYKSRQMSACKQQFVDDNSGKKDDNIYKLKLLQGKLSKQKIEICQLKRQHQRMKKVQCQLLKSTLSMSKLISQQDEQLKNKQATIMFSQEHLRRAKVEYQDLQAQYNQERKQFNIIIQEMKKLLHSQNLQIQKLQKESFVVESNKFTNISLNKLLPSNKGIKTSNEFLLPNFKNLNDEPDIQKNVSLEDSIMREYLKDTFNV